MNQQNKMSQSVKKNNQIMFRRRGLMLYNGLNIVPALNFIFIYLNMM